MVNCNVFIVLLTLEKNTVDYTDTFLSKIL